MPSPSPQLKGCVMGLVVVANMSQKLTAQVFLGLVLTELMLCQCEAWGVHIAAAVMVHGPGPPAGSTMHVPVECPAPTRASRSIEWAFWGRTGMGQARGMSRAGLGHILAAIVISDAPAWTKHTCLDPLRLH